MALDYHLKRARNPCRVQYSPTREQDNSRDSNMMNTVLIWLVLFTLGSLAAKIPTNVDKKGQTLDTNTKSLGKRNSALSSASDDASLVTKREARRSVGWLKANTSPVCFGTRNGLYGRFYAPASGRLAAIKLVHLYGFVSCDTRRSYHWSFWGCGHHGGLIDHIDVTITTSANHILFPPSQFMQYNHRGGKWSKIPGYNSFSPEIVLSRFSYEWVHSGQPLRLWYGEDLANYTEHDNGGRVCADVYALYVYA